MVKADATLKGVVTLDTRKLDRGVKRSDKAMKGLGDTMNTVFGVTMGVGAVAALGKVTWAMGQMGAQTLRLRTSFKQVAEYHKSNSKTILTALRETSLGAISDSELMLNANRAMMLGLGGDAEQLSNLMQVAAFRARAMGLSTQQAFNDIVTGIGRKSLMILDNLGIVGISMSQTTTTAELMAEVVTQGMEQISEAGGYAADDATKFEALSASLANLKDSVNVLLAAPVGAAADWLSGRLNLWTKNFEMLDLILTKLGDENAQTAAKIANDWTVSTAESKAAVASAMEMYDKQIDAMVQASLASAGMTEALGEEAVAFAVTNEQLGRYKDRETDMIMGTVTAIDKTNAMTDAVTTLVMMVNTAPKSIESMRLTFHLLNAMVDAGRIGQQQYREMLDLAQKNWWAYSKSIDDARKRLGYYLDEQGNLMKDGEKVTYSVDQLGAAFRITAEQTVEADQALKDYIFSLYDADSAIAQVTMSHRGMLTSAQREEQALARSGELETRRVEAREAQAEATKAAADDFRAKMESANEFIANDIATKTHKALGLGAPTGDQPAEPVRRMLDVAVLGEKSDYEKELRPQIARAWEVMRPGQGVMDAILGDEGTLKRWSQTLYAMVSDPELGAGLLKALEMATGDEWIDEMALATEVGVLRGIDALAEKGREALDIPVNIVPAGAEGITENPILAMAQEPLTDGTLLAKSTELGSTITTGVQTGLVMATGQPPLQPLNTDIQTAINKIIEFKDLWDNLNDKKLKLLIEMTGGGNGDGGDGGGGDGLPPGDYDYPRGGGGSHLVPVVRLPVDTLQSGGFIGGRRGDPVPVMAHAGEIILNEAQQGRVAGAMGGAVHVHMEGPNFFRNEADMRRFGQIITPYIERARRTQRWAN